MAEPEKIAAISVGLGVNLGSLDSDLNRIKTKIATVERDHVVPFSVGTVSFGKVEEQIRAIVSKRYPVTVTLSLAQGQITNLRNRVAAGFKEQPVPVRLTVTQAEIAALRKEIEKSLGVSVKAPRTGGKSGAGAPPTPEPARARAQAGGIASGGATGQAVAAINKTARNIGTLSSSIITNPAGAVASAVKDARAQAGQSGTNDALAEGAIIAAGETQKNIRRVANETKATVDEHGVTHVKGTPVPGALPVPRGRGQLAKKLARQTAAITRLGPDELAAQKVHQVESRLASGEEERYRTAALEQEGPERSREPRDTSKLRTRGARRSGARLPEEPVLTDLDRLSTSNQALAADYEASERRKQELLGGAHQVGLGALGAHSLGPETSFINEGTAANPRYNPVTSSPGREGGLARTFNLAYLRRIDPRLGEAYRLSLSGKEEDLAAARDLTRGIYAEIKGGADPRARRKFSRLFRNVEKIPAEHPLLLQHAAFTGLLFDLRRQIEPGIVNQRSSRTPLSTQPAGRKVSQRESEAIADLIARGMDPMEARLKITGTPSAPSIAASRAKEPVARAGMPSWSIAPELRPGEAEMRGQIAAAKEAFESSIAGVARVKGQPFVLPPEAEALKKTHDALAAAFREKFPQRAMGGMVQGYAMGGRLSTTARGYGYDWQKLSKEQRMRQPWCSYCGTFGSPTNPLEADHIVPLKAGGARLDPRNITTACKSCNSLKKDKLGWGPPGRKDGGPVGKWPRLYRGDTSDDRGGIVPEWLLGDPRYKAILDAQGRWFTHSPEIAQYYVDHFGAGGPGKVSSVAVGRRQLEKYRVSNQSADVRRFSALPEEEWFLPRSVAKRARPLKGYAAGGPADKGTYLVGEIRPELYVGKSGRMAIVGEKGPQLFTPPEDGEIKPFVPEWIRRMQKNAKDFTGSIYARAEGGPVENRAGTLRYRGPRGFVTASDAAFAARASGVASFASANVQRVSVVNWPAGIGSIGGGGGVASTPYISKDEAARIPAIAAALKSLEDTVAGTTKVKAKEPREESPTRLTREEHARSGIAARETVSDFNSAVAEYRFQRQAISQQTPARALPTAGGQLLAFRLGRGEILRRQQVAGAAIQAFVSQITQLKSAEQDLSDAQAKLDTEESGPNRKAVEDLTKARDLQLTRTKELDKQVGVSIKNAGALHLKLGALLGDTLGIIGGTTVFGATLAVAQAGVTALGSAVAPIIDQLAGFQGISTKVTSGLGEQTTALKGNAAAAVAQATELSGLNQQSLAYLQTSLGVTASTKAGAAAALQAQDLIKAGVFAAGGGAPQGLFGGYGGVLGGPLFAQQLGGGQGFTEAAAGTLSSLQGQKTSLPPASPGDLFSFLLGPLTGNPSAGQPTSAETEANQKKQQAAQTAITAYLSSWQDATKRGASFLGQAASTFQLVQTQDTALLDATKNWGAAAGDGGNAARIAASGFALMDPITKKAVASISDYQQAVQQAAVGFGIPDVSTLIAQQKLALQAQFQTSAARTKFATGTQIPAQFGFGLLQQPLIAPAAGVLPRGGIGAAGLSGGAAAQVANSLKQATALQAQLNAEGQQGLDIARQTIVDNHVSADNLRQYDLSLKQATIYSKEIAAIQTQIDFTQSTLSAQQFNTQMIFLARNLSDAKGLAGQLTGPTNLGALERQAFLLGREATSLQLMLSQRQIATSLALAQFQAPGQSPEERAARRAEATIQAQVAQKQLNIQKQQFGLAGQTFNVQAARGIFDATKAIELAQAEHNASVEIAALTKQLNANQAAEAKAQSVAQAVFQSAVGNFDTVLSAAATDIATIPGTVLADVIKGIEKALQQAGPGVGVGGGVGSSGATASGLAFGNPGIQPVPSGTNPNTQARGTVGLALSAQQAIFGEAGTEAYAILRQPRIQSIGGGLTGGGGGTSIHITFSGPVTVRTEADINRLAQVSARLVETALNRKAGLLNLRGPAR